MKSTLWLSPLCVCAIASLAHAADKPAARGGLIVCIGEVALERVSGDWKTPGRTFHCLVTSDAEVDAIRRKLRAADCHGKVSAAKFDGRRLPYIDNLVTRIVVADAACAVPSAEVARVLAPYGTAAGPKGARSIPRPATDLGGGRVAFTKPYPEAMDEWPQYLHGADNNCVAADTVVGPPRHVQWVSGPAWTRAHIGAATVSSMVSSGGRLFTIEDRETAENPLLPAKWKLVARDAFNGIVLWTRAYPDWEQITVYIKDYHAQMQRRLVAVGDTVYCTPGLTAPVTALDAATGKVLREYRGTEKTQEFVYHEGRLYVIVGDRMRFFSYKGAAAKTAGKKGREGRNKKKQPPQDSKPKEGAAKLAFGGNGFPLSAYNPQTPNAQNPTCRIVAVDAATGEVAWRSGEIARYTGCSMALKGDRLVYQNTQGVFCLDARTGRELWAVRKAIPYGRGSSPHTLVIGDDAVYSEEGRAVRAYALADGSDFWGKSIPARKGYQASTDLFIAAGALWTCGACNDAGGVVKTKPTSFDLKTGDEIRTIQQKLSKPMGHDRCYRNFITERFFINSKTGGPDCMDLRTGTEWPASFTRGTCSMGPLPCNGLIYCGPWACQCHLPTGLHNFNAFYTDEASLPTRGQIVRVERSARLEKGEAYGRAGDAEDARSAPWPTYRQDARRYSGTREKVPAKGLARTWKVEFGKALTAPVIAGGKVFVAETETYVLRALSAGDGEPLWEYTAGGRIDSPPTYYRGLVLFGSRDGWLHCVRASDGALAWRFRDLPEKLICVFDRLESAWPIHGSVLIEDGTAYFCAGRSSYLDGGIFIYGLDPVTDRLRHRRQFYGPYAEDGFPAFVEEGNRSEKEVILGTTADVMTGEGGRLYIRHQAFSPDLTDAAPGKHLLASSGMLESKRQHREYKLVQEDFNHRKMWTTIKTQYPTGDIIVSDGTDYYAVFGHPVNRGSPFNPRGGYVLTAKTRAQDEWSDKWQTKMPITGKAMVLAGSTVFVAGAPLVFSIDDLGGAYAGRRGAALHAVSAADGSTLAEYKLERLPAWDGIAAAYGKLFIVNGDGSVECWGR
ncbi:MAG: outer membrane protein assembly factor BamB family protein [Planctomycetota bacterium]|jgi:outer membrane protein assembly factor BamB